MIDRAARCRVGSARPGQKPAQVQSLDHPPLAEDIVNALLEDEGPEDLVQRHAPNLRLGTATAMSSWGQIEFSIGDGSKVRYSMYTQTDPSPYEAESEQQAAEEFANIAKFDVKEYERWQCEPLVEFEQIDILNIGFWLKNGSYEPASATHRRMSVGEDEP